MRRLVKFTIGAAALVALGLAALGGTGAYFVLRHMDSRSGSEADAAQAIEAVKRRFGGRPPLIEIADPRRADVRVYRPGDASQVHVDTIHIISWKQETGEIVRADMPLWLMRFSSVNLLSQLGLAPARFRLTVSDVERYGPGVLIDYGTGAFRVFAWVE